MRTDFRPEGGRSLAAVRAQRRGIAEAADLLLDALPASAARRAHAFRTVPVVAVEATPATARRLESSPLVESVEPDRRFRPLLSTSVGLIGATALDTGGLTGAGQTVAVLDTGVDPDHPFLAGRIVEEACYSARRDCPNGDMSQVGPGAGVPCPYSACWHGTHVAGIAAGSDATYGGVAPGAGVMSVQVFSRSGGSVAAWTSDILKGLERVHQLRDTYDFAAVNMSLGGGWHTRPCGSDSLRGAIANLRSAGIATVVASGNNGWSNAMSSPACVPEAVSVGSTTSPGDEVSGFSNAAWFLDLLAPGQVIRSAASGGGTRSAQGTSMATPHVAGAWALMKEAGLPGDGVDAILDRLKLAGKTIVDSRNGIAFPRIRVAASLAGDGPPDVDLVVRGGGRRLEGTGGRWPRIVFRIRLRAPTHVPVEIAFRTVPGSAKPGEDYRHRSGVRVFDPGERAKRIRVAIRPDRRPERRRERFFLELTQAYNASVAESRSRAVIRDDD